MKIAITGASGFVGTNFISENKEFNLVEIDLLTKKVGDVDFNGIDTVLHLAALVHQMKGAPKDQFFKINRDLAYEVAIKARTQGVRHFVFMSTAKVFGESTTGQNGWDEFSDCTPLDYYGKSKLEAENLIIKLETKTFKVAIIRSPLVYGPGVKANMYNLVKLVDRWFILPLDINYNHRSFVYIGNLIALMNQIILKQCSGIFIAGDRSSLSTSELIRHIGKSLKKPILLIRIPRFLVFLISKIKPSIIARLFGSLELNNLNTNRKLEFTPPYSTDDGINAMVNWYKKSNVKK